MAQVEVSYIQLLTITRLKFLLGERGYTIVTPVPEHFRRHERDFVAYLPDDRAKFLVVRPTRDDKISISAPLIPSQFNQLEEEIKRLRNESSLTRIIWMPWELTRHAKWSSYTPPPQIRYVRG